MQYISIKSITELLRNSDRVRVYRDGAAVFIGWGFDIKSHCERYNITGDEEVKEYRAHLDTAHVDWKKRGLLPPIDRESTPQYIAGDMRIDLFYDIYI